VHPAKLRLFALEGGEWDCPIQFNELIIKNILANRISPVNFTALLSFKSSIAEMFYTRVDSITRTEPDVASSAEAQLHARLPDRHGTRHGP
jgi:hypothetical protein